MKKSKIVVQTNKYFTESGWIKAFNSKFRAHHELFNLKPCNDRQSLASEFQDAQYGFLLNNSPEILISAKNLDYIYFGISDANLKHQYLTNDIKIDTSRGLASNLVAEYCIYAVLNMIRNFSLAHKQKLFHKWEQSGFLSSYKNELSDYTIGVLGFGPIGKKVASTFKGLGSKVLVCSKNEHKEDWLNDWYSVNEMKLFLSEVDILILCLPSTNETKSSIDLTALQTLGSDGYLINVSRGDIVVEKDLVYSLKKNIIKGAAIDVSQYEPHPFLSPLWGLPNLFFTPHIAGNINLIATKIQNDFCLKLMEYSC